eukprot:CAMPEP_0170399202 /NCGR_PEP_ID=MMETSP0117_2-20130122/23833_1 /TAXON_ID=400756 /ORGANISM="Durinskia baltica, Strain CSIRO CS-38" /LENGTH=216 /DNA_ID=CAMNT_0010655857 /DNA_START=92 /DNA_END=742 /DNA_ORIENTATION=-
MSLRTPQEINNMWFDSDRSKFNNPEFIKFSMGKWFLGTVPEVEQLFKAESKQIEDLADENSLGEQWFTPEGYLARIVMFDQGSRTAFRGTPKAFAFDEAAAKLTLSIVQKGWLVEKYLPIERQAILTPLLHSEHLPDHDAAVSLIPLICEGLEDEAAVACFAGTPPFFEEHREVVRKFGRFPSRNGALGRENTAAEEEWLNSPDLPAWARSQQAKK